jgi:predicted secreted protein
MSYLKLDVDSDKIQWRQTLVCMPELGHSITGSCYFKDANNFVAALRVMMGLGQLPEMTLCED